MEIMKNLKIMKTWPLKNSKNSNRKIYIATKLALIWTFAHSDTACCSPTMPVEISPNTFSLLKKEKIFNTETMVTCKKSAAIVK